MTDQQTAFILYREDVPQKEIARILNRSEQTITKWKQTGNWDQQIAEEALSEQTIQEEARDLLRYQLRTLKRIKETNQSEADKDGKPRLIGKGSIDAIRDLFNITKTKEVEWALYVRVIRELFKFLKDVNLPLAQQTGDYLDDFLNSKRKAQ